MGKKYPTFERVTAGRLTVGATVLIRDGAQDAVPINETRFGPDQRLLPPGLYVVDDISSTLMASGRRASRYYRLVLIASDGGIYVPTMFSSVLRWNRVVPNG